MKQIKTLNDGTKIYLLNGKLHREDGPAIEWLNGTKLWYINDLRHREDGPAIEYTNGSVEWFYNDVKYDVNSAEELMIAVLLK